MTKLLSFLAVIFLFAWIVGFFVLDLGMLIHLLLLAAVVVIILQIIEY